MVTFVMSHACPLQCDFCCSTREVVGPGRISRTMMTDCLVRFGREQAVQRFAFTGGDPFLYRADIAAAVRAARDCGVARPFQIVTSAYWAQDDGQVLSLLGELRALGLDKLGLSYDREHARWVSPGQIEMVCKAAEALSIAVSLTGTFWDRDDSVEKLLPDLVQRQAIHIINMPVAPMGRARVQARMAKRPAVPIEEKLSCGQPGHYSLSIYPDGEVYPCCSGGFQIEGRLSCGNVHRDPASRLLYAALTKFHVRLVKEFGWGLLYELVEREAPELASKLPRLEDAGGVCELCRDLNVGFADKLAPLYTTIEIEYARTRAEFEWRAIGAGTTADRLWFDNVPVSLPELLDSLTSHRDVRLDYLAGSRCIAAAPKSAPA